MQKPTAAILTIIAIFSRLLPHPANFTTIGATTLFAGSKLQRPWNYLVPFIAMVVTDLILGAHGTMLFVYASFAVMIMIGEKYLRGKLRWQKIGIAAVGGSALFFLVTNFGVWLTTTMYPKNFAGLIEAYIMGLPFWRNMLAADLLFSYGFFYLYQAAVHRSIIARVDKTLVNYLGLEAR